MLEFVQWDDRRTDHAPRRKQKQGHDCLLDCFLRVEREMGVGCRLCRGFRVLVTPLGHFLPLPGSLLLTQSTTYLDHQGKSPSDHFRKVVLELPCCRQAGDPTPHPSL